MIRILKYIIFQMRNTEEIKRIARMIENEMNQFLQTDEGKDALNLLKSA